MGIMASASLLAPGLSNLGKQNSLPEHNKADNTISFGALSPLQGATSITHIKVTQLNPQVAREIPEWFVLGRFHPRTGLILHLTFPVLPLLPFLPCQRYAVPSHAP